jgi:uncharacterized protein YutE (UPF0331/DUF86 family)
MVAEQRLERMLEALQAALLDLRRYAVDVPHDRLVSDGDASRMVRQALQEALQASIDAGFFLLSRAGVPTPSSYRAVFLALRDQLGLDPGLAESMAEAAGLRNVLVHIYTSLDLERIHRAYTVDRSVLDAFAAWLAGQPEGSEPG